MKNLSIESVKIALQNARDAARELRLSGADEVIQDAAYEEVYQLRMLLDDVVAAQSIVDSVAIPEVTTWQFITIVHVQCFKFEAVKRGNEYVILNDNGMINTAHAVQKYLNYTMAV